MMTQMSRSRKLYSLAALMMTQMSRSLKLYSLAALMMTRTNLSRKLRLSAVLSIAPMKTQTSRSPKVFNLGRFYSDMFDDIVR
jgi:hypothetical protein